MSFEIARAVWNYTGTDLNGTQTAVLVRMAWYASDAGRDVFPSIDKLAEQTKFGRTTIKEAIKHLIKLGFLEVRQQSKGRYTNNYTISMPRLSLNNEFNDDSSSCEEESYPQQPVAIRPVGEKQPVGKRPVNRSAGDPQPVGSRPQYTSNDDFKNNNVVEKSKTANRAIGNELNKLAATLGVDQYAVGSMLDKHPHEEVFKKLKLLSAARKVDKPTAWFIASFKDGYRQEKSPFKDMATCAVRSVEETNQYFDNQLKPVVTPKGKIEGLKSLRAALGGFK